MSANPVAADNLVYNGKNFWRKQVFSLDWKCEGVIDGENVEGWSDEREVDNEVSKKESTGWVWRKHDFIINVPFKNRLFQPSSTSVWNVWNYFIPAHANLPEINGLLQLMKTFQYVECRWNNYFEIISELFQHLKIFQKIILFHM